MCGRVLHVTDGDEEEAYLEIAVRSNAESVARTTKIFRHAVGGKKPMYHSESAKSKETVRSVGAR